MHQRLGRLLGTRRVLYPEEQGQQLLCSILDAAAQTVSQVARDELHPLEQQQAEIVIILDDLQFLSHEQTGSGVRPEPTRPTQPTIFGQFSRTGQGRSQDFLHARRIRET
jgi:hypothetical protein